MNELLSVCQAAIGLLGIGRRNVDNGFAQYAAHANFLRGARHFIFEVVHVRHGGNAAFDHLDHSVETAPIDDLAIHQFVLERKNEALQAVGHVVAEAAKHRHRRVCVGVDHAGHHDIARGVDCFVGNVAHGYGSWTYRHYPAISDDNGTVFVDVLRGVHRHDIGMINNDVGRRG